MILNLIIILAITGQLDVAASKGRGSPGSSSGTPSTSTAATSSVQMEALLQTLSLPEGLEKTYSQVQNDEHKKRLNELKKELDYLKTTDWQFKSVDDLIGK